MNIRARLNHLFEIRGDSIKGSGFLYLKMREHPSIVPVHGNPVELLILDAVLDNLSLETVRRCFERMAEDYPNDYTRYRHYNDVAGTEYESICAGILRALDHYQWAWSPLSRPDQRNLDWLREYYKERLSELSK